MPENGIEIGEKPKKILTLWEFIKVTIEEAAELCEQIAGPGTSIMITPR